MESKEKIKINKKKFVCVVGILLIICVILGITKIINLFLKEVGAGNDANMGLAVEKDGIVYFNKYEDGIVKVKNGEEYQITDETAYSMNIVGDIIYYLTVSDLNTIDIKSVETNGNGLRRIKTIYTAITKIYIQDNYIYYATNKDGNGIVKLNIETEKEEKIIEANIQDFVLYDGKIYFTDMVNTLSSVNTSGLDLQVISSTENIQKIQILKNWIYYYDANKKALCKMKIDGTSLKTVSTFVQNEMYNITNKKIYFFDEVNRQICSSDLKGKVSKGIVSLDSTKTKINIVNDIIYYLDESENETKIYQMYRVKTNGKQTKSIDY